MTNDGSSVFHVAGRDWTFKLTVGQWIKLQRHFGGGPQKISTRFGSDDWVIEDIREMIERGLEGGGMTPNDARETATLIVDGQPLDLNYRLAIDVMGAAWAGLEEYMKKKAVVEAATNVLSRIGTGNGTLDALSEAESSAVSSRPKQSSSASASSST